MIGLALAGCNGHRQIDSMSLQCITVGGIVKKIAPAATPTRLGGIDLSITVQIKPFAPPPPLQLSWARCRSAPALWTSASVDAVR
jgi:hypothetical protein